MSMANGLAVLIEDGTVPNALKGKAIDVQNWIAERTTECIAGLVDTNNSPIYLEAKWELPNTDVPWEGDFEDVYVEVVSAVIPSVYKPENGALTCTSLHENDDEVFTDESSSPFSNTYDVELDEADGDISGPYYQGGRVVASSDFASLSTSCGAPTCSVAHFSDEVTGAWAIDSMSLFADGSVVFSNGTITETVTDARLELYKQATGSVSSGTGGLEYTISAGDAYFIFAGEANDEVATLVVSNSTDIVATESSGIWTLDPFDVEYVDDSSDSWVLTVNTSDWL